MSRSYKSQGFNEGPLRVKMSCPLVTHLGCSRWSAEPGKLLPAHPQPQFMACTCRVGVIHPQQLQPVLLQYYSVWNMTPPVHSCCLNVKQETCNLVTSRDSVCIKIFAYSLIARNLSWGRRRSCNLKNGHDVINNWRQTNYCSKQRNVPIF